MEKELKRISPKELEGYRDAFLGSRQFKVIQKNGKPYLQITWQSPIDKKASYRVEKPLVLALKANQKKYQKQ